MLIEKEHIDILKALEEKKSVNELRNIFKDMRFVNRKLIELKFMGLIKIEKQKVEILEAGKLLVKAFDLAKPKEVTPYWIGPEIIQMIQVGLKTNFLPQEWVEYLDKKGLVEGNSLNEAARLVYEAYKKSLPDVKLILSHEVIDFITEIPPGPADLKELIRIKNALGVHQDAIKHAAMLKLLTFSPIEHGRFIYQLTPAAKVLREVLFKVYLEVIDERTMALLEKKERTEEEKEELREKGLMSGEELTEEGKKLLLVKELLTKELPVPIPYFILNEEIIALNVLKEYWDKYLESGNDKILPTPEFIEEKLIEEKGMENKLAGFVINLLYWRGFVENGVERRKVVMKITEKGYKALRMFDESEDITTNSTKALTYGVTEKAPLPSWLDEAEERKLIHHWITERGKTILEWTLEPRTLLLTRFALLAVYKIPRKKYVTMEQLVDEVYEELTEEEKKEEKVKERIEEAISQAEAMGIFIIERNKAVILTDVGEKIKEVLEYGNAQELLHTWLAINPRSVEVLEAYEKLLPEIKKEAREGKDMYEVEIKLITNYLKLTPEYVDKWLKVLRATGLIGRTGITEAGKALLEAKKLLAEKKYTIYL